MTIVLESRMTYKLAIPGAGEDNAASGDLDVTADTVVIEGRNAKIDGKGLDRIFDIASGSTVEISDLVLRDGSVTGESGGAIRNAGVLGLDDLSISSSKALGEGASGGAVFNDNGTLTVKDTTMRGNESTRAGGAIESLNGEVMLDNVTLTKNTTGPAPGNGGGLHITGAGDATINKSKVMDNYAAAEGGGLWNSTGTMTVTRSNIEDNVAAGAAADDGGGGLFNNGGLLKVDNSDIEGNEATGTSGSGGGIFNNAGTLEVEHTDIDDNRSSRAGGGIETLEGTVVLYKVQLESNRTGSNPGNGGGLHTTGAGVVTIDRSEVTRNRASNEGGGLWNSGVGTMMVTDSEIERNKAPVGPNVFNVGGEFTIDGDPVPAG